ncbi:hypothetical protein FRC12_009309 [Ceratobasidium sp. 428]|nr:hypothetical protein FRC12_009309 [Ceratobasidium sp. 428]
MIARSCRPHTYRSFSTRIPTAQSLCDAARIQLGDSGPCIQRLIDVRTLSHPTLTELAKLPNHSFTIHSGFLSTHEQDILLKASLTKLGGKRRRKSPLSALPTSPLPATDYPLHGIFGRDVDYNFEEGHFDGVIRDYREMTVSSWPASSPAGLADILLRLYRLVDPHRTPAAPGTTTPPNVQTHILHLASIGIILPHVDNIEASGNMIAGVSLGDTRVLRMSRDEETFDVLLESGSVYVQRDDIRYRWKHEIPNNTTFQGRVVGSGGQRLSVMLRDKHTQQRT